MSNNQNQNSINESINVEINPLVIQLKEFGYDNIYSRRVFYYLHPEDIDEALNYMSIENGNRSRYKPPFLREAWLRFVKINKFACK